MLKKIIILLLLVSLSPITQAEPMGYETLSPVQPTQNPNKIEVIEFFWYGCPHCYSLEAILGNWLETLPENVEFIRQPVAWNNFAASHAKAYFVAEALGVVEKVHADFFDAIQNKKQKLINEDQLAEFFVAHGVDEAEFRSTFNSFLVDAKLRQAKAMSPRYGITGVPAIIVNGKYKTNGPLATSHENMITIMNNLIKQESQGK